MKLPGINIQFPISKLILSGKKTIETRHYSLPEKYVGQEMFFIETPGKNGNFSARIVAIIVFGKSFQYSNSDDFYADKARHFVSPKSPYRWKKALTKWGWPILRLQILPKAVPAPKRRGIRYTREIKL